MRNEDSYGFTTTFVYFIFQDRVVYKLRVAPTYRCYRLTASRTYEPVIIVK